MNGLLVNNTRSRTRRTKVLAYDCVVRKDEVRGTRTIVKNDRNH